MKCVCGHHHEDMCPCGCSIYEPDHGQTEWTRDEGDIKPSLCLNNSFRWNPDDVTQDQPHPRGGPTYGSVGITRYA